MYGEPLLLLPVFAGVPRRTLLNSLYLLISIVSLWAGAIYVPASVTLLAARAGFAQAEGVGLASYAGMLLAIGTVLGCLLVPKIAERVGRRATLPLYFLITMVFTSP